MGFFSVSAKPNPSNYPANYRVVIARFVRSMAIVLSLPWAESLAENRPDMSIYARPDLQMACPGEASWYAKAIADGAGLERDPIEGRDSKLVLKLQQLASFKGDAQADTQQEEHTKPKRRIADYESDRRDTLAKAFRLYGRSLFASIGDEGVEQLVRLLLGRTSDVELSNRLIGVLVEQVERETSLQYSIKYSSMIDALRMRNSRSQLYGMQYDTSAERVLPQDIQDVENVDNRRAKAHLMPLADYYCVVLYSLYGHGIRPEED
jgi:hypothetical protein